MATTPLKRTTTARSVLMAGLGLTLVGLSVGLPSDAQSGRDRWLEVSRLSGSVTYRGASVRSAQPGDRLSQPGHGIETSSRASTVLEIDTGIGTISVAENTHFSVQRLDTLADGSEITILSVTQGQARIQTRPFTNINSRLELHTPSGVASVRGTEFGVNVAADGKSTIGTLQGAVEVSAQDVSVQVGAGFASVLVPGQPPTPPIPLDQELLLELVDFHRRDRTLYIQGRINPTNVLLLEGEAIEIGRSGWFSTVRLLPHGHRTVTFTVRNPLGEVRDYSVPVWQADIDRD
ncbi:MAG: FecR domain-containing protein [Leptolyngbya sp. RL_3_1]|nr:FecR domain-containing protein [Leptolyngbya sp. RL_3_1]